MEIGVGILKLMANSISLIPDSNKGGLREWRSGHAAFDMCLKSNGFASKENKIDQMMTDPFILSAQGRMLIQFIFLGQSKMVCFCVFISKKQGNLHSELLLHQ